MRYNQNTPEEKFFVVAENLDEEVDYGLASSRGEEKRGSKKSKRTMSPQVQWVPSHCQQKNPKTKGIATLSTQ